nr:glycosyltransferase [uncultured Butyrivibrio sp.]
MKFSIIIPVYNVERYINKAITSVLEQEYDDYEVILVDDGSTDSSGKVCDDVAEKHDKFKVIHQDNSGLSAARNIGISNAHGEYIILLDSDDFFVDKYVLGKIAGLITSTCEEYLDIIVFESKKFVDGKFTETIFPLKWLGDKVYDGKEFLMQVLQSRDSYTWMAWQYVYNRKLFIDNSLSFEEGIVFEDVEFTYRALLKADKIKVLAEPLYAYRINDSSITKKISISLIKDFLYVIEKNINSVNRMDIGDGLKRELNNNFSFNYFTIIMLAETISDRDTKKDAYRIIDEKSFINSYVTRGKHMIPSKVLKMTSVSVVGTLFGFRRKLKRLQI